jgi:hypothetical protein
MSDWSSSWKLFVARRTYSLRVGVREYWPGRKESIVLCVSELTFCDRISFIAQVATVQPNFVASEPITEADIDGAEGPGQRCIPQRCCGNSTR